MGMPQQTRNIAVANGPYFQNLEIPAGGLIFDSNAVDAGVNLGWGAIIPGLPYIAFLTDIVGIFDFSVNNKVWSVKGNNQNNKVFESNTYYKPFFFNIKLRERNRSFTSKASYDSGPASYPPISQCGQPVDTPPTGFMSSSSAIGALVNNNSDLTRDTRFQNNSSCFSIFDSWYVNNIQETHVQFSIGNTNFIWNEINNPQSPCQQKMCKDVSISGSSLLCSSGTYTLANLPAGASISWTKSANLSYTSGQNTAAYRVTASGTGSGWVEARITLNGCGTAVIRKNVNVSKPAAFSISGPVSLSRYQSGTYSFPAVPGASSYDITVSKYAGSCTSNCFSVSDNGTRSVVVLFNQVGTYLVEAEARNSCGTTSRYKYVTISTTGGGGGCLYTLELTSSNPAADVFSYQLIAPPTDPCLTQASPGEQSLSADYVTILDEYGNIVVQQAISSENFSIDLSGQRAGVYLVKVGWKGQELSDRIIRQ